MTIGRRISTESIIDRKREALIAKIISGTASDQERSRLEELSSARAALMKKRMMRKRGKALFSTKKAS